MAEDEKEAKKEEVKTAGGEVVKEAGKGSNEIMDKVVDRLKFFFSNANVRQDFFIRKLLMKEDGDNPGKVPVESLLRFNTIKQHTTDPAIVVEAAKSLSDLLVVDEDDVAIGRVNPFTDSMMDENIPLSLYVRNVPLIESEDNQPSKYGVSVDDIRKLFAPYGDVALVKLKFAHSKDIHGDEDLGIETTSTNNNKRHKRKKYPIGHALVEYHKLEDLQKAADATLTMKGGEKSDPKDKLLLGESKTELSVMLLKEYIDMRKKEKEGGGVDGDKEDTSSGKKRELDEDDDEDDDNKEFPTFKFDWKPGCVIKLNGLPDTCDREALLDTVSKGLEISVAEVKARNIYVDYSRGQTDGAIRFAEFADYISKIAERLKSGDLEISSTKVEDAKVLEGTEEEEYWKNFIDFKNKQLRHKEEERRAKKKRRKQGGRK